MSKNTLVKYPASPKQESFISKLLSEVKSTDGLGQPDQDTLKKVLAAEVIDKQDASYLITALMRLPKHYRAAAAEGYYVHQDGTYLVVVSNKAKTSTYAKALDVSKEQGQRAKARWVYAPGKGADVAHMSPMTLEQAAKFGHLHGVCFVCCKALTDPESLKRGIGPVCAKKFAPVRVEQDENQAEADLAAHECRDEPTINVAALARRNRKA